MAKEVKKAEVKETKRTLPVEFAAFKIGTIGRDVKELQKLLGLEQTGIYDEATDKAVKAYK